MKKFYVASSFRNINAVRYVSSQLINQSYAQTYDWTQNEKAKTEGTATIEDLRVIGEQERNAVMACDFLIVLLPGGNGTHIELGIALGQGKRIFLYSPDEGVNHFETTSTFYHLPEVVKCFGTLDELVEIVTT